MQNLYIRYFLLLLRYIAILVEKLVVKSYRILGTAFATIQIGIMIFVNNFWYLVIALRRQHLEMP